MNCGEAVFGLLRLSPDGQTRVLCLQNVTGAKQFAQVNLEKHFGAAPADRYVINLLSQQRFDQRRKRALPLGPYQTLWLARESRNG